MLFLTYSKDEAEVEDIPEETRNFLLEWLKGRIEEVSTQLYLKLEGLLLMGGSVVQTSCSAQGDY